MPRDVAPEAADLDGVNVYTLDQLHTIANENRENRAAAIDKAEEMVDRELAQVRRKTGEPGGRAGGAAPRRAGGADAPGGIVEGRQEATRPVD